MCRAGTQQHVSSRGICTHLVEQEQAALSCQPAVAFPGGLPFSVGRQFLILADPRDTRVYNDRNVSLLGMPVIQDLGG